MRKLAVEDILDLRAYERVRSDMRAEVITLKKVRRISVGEVVSVVFENTKTMHFQVQEMARAEKMLRDDQIAHEVATYNEVIPDDNQLSCTLFIELVEDAQMRDWLPRLVGIHQAVTFVLEDGSVVRGYDPGAERLTREDITAAVHFLKFDFSEQQVAAFLAGPVKLCVDHPKYPVNVQLTTEQHDELSKDLVL